MSHLLDEVLAQAANGSPITVALSAESVAVLFFGSEFLSERRNWLDKAFDLMDEVSDADWDAIEKLVGNAYEELMTPVYAVGTISMWGTTTAPDRHVICDGRTISRTDYAELFALWGTTFGAGNGTTTFNVPNFSDRSPMGVGTIAAAIGNSAGTSNETLTTAQMPSHTHAKTDPGHAHTVGDTGHTHQQRQFAGADSYVAGAAGGANPTVPNGTNTTNTVKLQTGLNSGTGISVINNTTGISYAAAGGGGSHNNVGPVLGINFIVYAGQT